MRPLLQEAVIGEGDKIDCWRHPLHADDPRRLCCHRMKYISLPQGDRLEPLQSCNLPKPWVSTIGSGPPEVLEVVPALAAIPCLFATNRPVEAHSRTLARGTEHD